MHTGTLNLHTLLVCEHKDKTSPDIYTASLVWKSLLQEELAHAWTTAAVDVRPLKPRCKDSGDRGLPQGSAPALGELLPFGPGLPQTHTNAAHGLNNGLLPCAAFSRKENIKERVEMTDGFKDGSRKWEIKAVRRQEEG